MQSLSQCSELQAEEDGVPAAAETAAATRKRLAETACARQDYDQIAVTALGLTAEEHARCAAGL